jgi:hypothetical protein
MRHRWNKTGRYAHCLKCGASRDKGYLTPHYTDSQGNRHIGVAPPCVSKEVVTTTKQ